jgi:uncharacterized protein (UPF0335 family)
MSSEILREKLDKGWLHAKMFFEVMAASESLVKEALKNHIERIKRMENVKVIAEKFGEIEKVENPPRKLKEAYSQIVDVEVLVSSLENLLYTVMFFGPSSIEIVGPKEFRVKLDSAQSMVNAVAEMMHRYTAGGTGGIVISTKK